MESYRQIEAAMILLLSILSLQCGVATAALLQEGQLYVGWAGRNITPDEPVVLEGSFHLRIAKDAANPVTCTALAIETREGEKVIDQAVMVSCDLVGITRQVQEKVREAVKTKLPDLSPRKIFLNATHTHTAPVTRAWVRDIPVEGVMQPEEYIEFLTARVADAVVEAWNNRKPSAVSWALGQAVIGYNRRAIYSEPQSNWIGTYTSAMYGKTDVDIFRGIEGYEDHGAEMLFFWDDSEKLTGILINITCPSQEREAEERISADFWHDARVAIRQRHGEGLFIFGQCGAAGDQSPHPIWRKAAKAEMLKRKGLTSWQELGLRVAKAVDEVMPYAKKDIRRKVVFRHIVEEIGLPRRMVTKAEHDESLQNYEKWKDKQSDQRAGWFKRVVDRYNNQQSESPHFPMELHVIRLCDIAIASNPFELFLDFGVRMEARSKAVMTLIVQLSCDYSGYLPTAKAVAGGHYSATVQSNNVGPEGGQVLVDETVKRINEMWE